MLKEERRKHGQLKEILIKSNIIAVVRLKYAGESEADISQDCCRLSKPCCLLANRIKNLPVNCLQEETNKLK